jgi:hypothetical protein
MKDNCVLVHRSSTVVTTPICLREPQGIIRSSTESALVGVDDMMLILSFGLAIFYCHRDMVLLRTYCCKTIRVQSSWIETGGP